MLRKRSRTDTTVSSEDSNEMNEEMALLQTEKKKANRMPSPNPKPKSYSGHLTSNNKHSTHFVKDERFEDSPSGITSGVDLSYNGYKFIERFNRDMMEQFLQHQQRTQVCLSESILGLVRYKKCYLYFLLQQKSN